MGRRMSEVRQVTIRLSRPSGADPGRIEQAHYLVTKGFVTLTDAGGMPLLRSPTNRNVPGAGARWESLLSEGDDPHRITSKLLWAKWKASHTSDFSRRIRYPASSIY